MSERKSLLVVMANKYDMEPKAFNDMIKATVMPSKVPISNEQFCGFLSVANEYNLNPLTKEIYAFPSNGGIQPIVSIDGWMKMINNHKQFDGMEFVDHHEEGKLVAITVKIHRKDRQHPIQVTEYMSECRRKTSTWDRWPARMLRHKAAIQGARYAFGFSGIVDPDEAARFKEAELVDAEVVVDKGVSGMKEKLKKIVPMTEDMTSAFDPETGDIIGVEKVLEPIEGVK